VHQSELPYSRAGPAVRSVTVKMLLASRQGKELVPKWLWMAEEDLYCTQGMWSEGERELCSSKPNAR